MRRRQWEKAKAEFRTETRLRPGDSEAAWRLGTTLLQTGKVAEARAALKRANQLRPEMPQALYSFGQASLLDGDRLNTEKAWLDVIRTEKENALAAQAYFGLLGIYRAQGNAAKADAEMREFQRLSTTH
jgi:Flp pilus assembly protein TadD